MGRSSSARVPTERMSRRRDRHNCNTIRIIVEEPSRSSPVVVVGILWTIGILLLLHPLAWALMLYYEDHRPYNDNFNQRQHHLYDPQSMFSLLPPAWSEQLPEPLQDLLLFLEIPSLPSINTTGILDTLSHCILVVTPRLANGGLSLFLVAFLITMGTLSVRR